ncbi:hypothetical protein ACWGGS_02065 [Streptomyces decoyicus]
MAPSAVVSRVFRSGRVPYPVRLAAGRATVFAVASTVLAVTGHHVVFDVSPSWAARAVMVMASFLLALPRAVQVSTVQRQVVQAAGAQAVGVCWFAVGAGAAHGQVQAAWAVMAVHLGLTVLLALLLHGVQSCGYGLFCEAATELRCLCGWLSWLLFWRPDGVDGVTPAVLAAAVCSGPARASPVTVLLTECVVRRGPRPVCCSPPEAVRGRDGERIAHALFRLTLPHRLRRSGPVQGVSCPRPLL